MYLLAQLLNLICWIFHKKTGRGRETRGSYHDSGPIGQKILYHQTVKTIMMHPYLSPPSPLPPVHGYRLGSRGYELNFLSLKGEGVVGVRNDAG